MINFKGFNWSVDKITITDEQISVQMRSGTRTIIEDFYPWQGDGNEDKRKFIDEEIKEILSRFSWGKATQEITLNRVSYDELQLLLKEHEELKGKQ